MLPPPLVDPLVLTPVSISYQTCPSNL